jgi:hypothetical protein
MKPIRWLSLFLNGMELMSDNINIDTSNFSYFINSKSKMICLSFSTDNWKTNKIIKDDFLYIDDVEEYILSYIRDYKINSILKKQN